MAEGLQGDPSDGCGGSDIIVIVLSIAIPERVHVGVLVSSQTPCTIDRRFKIDCVDIILLGDLAWSDSCRIVIENLYRGTSARTSDT